MDNYDYAWRNIIQCAESIITFASFLPDDSGRRDVEELMSRAIKELLELRERSRE